MAQSALPRAPRALPRRSVLRGAAWSMPVIAAVSALPQAAASTAAPTWAITSDSWRGSLGGARSEVAFFVMRFAIVVPDGVELDGITAVMQFGANRLGTQIHGSVVGEIDGWAKTREEPLTPGSLEVARHIFQHAGDIAGPAVIPLEFEITGIGYISDIDLGTLTFTSPGADPIVFRLHMLNQGTPGSVATLQS